MQFIAPIQFNKSVSVICSRLLLRSGLCRSVSTIPSSYTKSDSSSIRANPRINLHRQFIHVFQRFYSDKKKIEEKGEGEGTKKASKSIYWTKEYQTIPNYITISRILASPLLTYAVIYDYKAYAFGGVLLFGFTDWLDGYLAKKLNQQTTIGAFLDPLADKVMIGSLTIGLLWKGLLPLELGTLIISRDVFLALCSIILRYIDKPSESGFWDVSSATFSVVPTLLSKVSAVISR